jgi:hypothetical protein
MLNFISLSDYFTQHHVFQVYLCGYKIYIFKAEHSIECECVCTLVCVCVCVCTLVCVCVCVLQLCYPFNHQQLGCYHSLVIVNMAVMKMGIQIFSEVVT